MSRSSSAGVKSTARRFPRGIFIFPKCVPQKWIFFSCAPQTNSAAYCEFVCTVFFYLLILTKLLLLRLQGKCTDTSPPEKKLFALFFLRFRTVDYYTLRFAIFFFRFDVLIFITRNSLYSVQPLTLTLAHQTKNEIVFFLLLQSISFVHCLFYCFGWLIETSKSTWFCFCRNKIIQNLSIFQKNLI